MTDLKALFMAAAGQWPANSAVDRSMSLMRLSCMKFEVRTANCRLVSWNSMNRFKEQELDRLILAAICLIR